MLQEVIVKFEGVYQSDMTQFYEYYILEALRIIATYLGHLNIDIGDKII